MRVLVIMAVTACGSAAPTAQPTTPIELPVPTIAAPKPATSRRAPVDPIAALAPDPKASFSMLQPGAAQLALDITPIESPGPTRSLLVTIVAEHGSRVRVAVRLDHARFLVWTERSRLYALLVRDERVARFPGSRGMPADKHVVIRAGAPVRRLAHKDGWTQIRHSGTFEIEGWVPDAALGEEAPLRTRRFVPRGHKTTMVTPGAVIYGEPKWGGPQLAVMANGYFVEAVREVDDAWSEVAFADQDLTLTGFVSKRAPPGRVHRKRLDPALAPVPVTPNATIASGTCLHSKVDGDPVGYIVGDREVGLASLGDTWWSVAVDSPWGPIELAARGADPASLAACAPKDTVPASRLVASPSAP